MSHRLKVTLFVLAFNIIGFAEGYLMREMGLLWLPAHYSRNGVCGGAGESAVAEAGKPVRESL
jgi:hypothetical protein